MARKRWSGEIKAKAMADIASGMTIKGVAEKYGMPRSTASHLAPSSKRGAREISKIGDLHDLEEAFRRQLALNFAAQEAIMRMVATDAEWLSKQTGSDAVTILNALFGKGGKLLGALYGPGAQRAIDDTGESEDPA